MKLTIKRLTAFAAALFVAVTSFAQVTTSSLSGSVYGQDGEPLTGAAVVAVHTPSGTQYYAVANTDGRYTIQGMRPGGPYEVTVSFVGCRTNVYKDITLVLGETYSQNATLKNSESLNEVYVIAEAKSKLNQEKTGVATNISNSQINELPTISRSISDIAKLSPYGGNGMSFAGTDGRMGNFTVDGANFNNNFGLSSSLPGGGNPISIDAIEEVQVVISPYDVRQTNFIGGGVNAITKSGTNKFKGSAYVYHQNENMRGNMAAGQEVAGARDKDRTTTYGFTLGGPIVKNKLFFFVSYEKSPSPTQITTWRASEDGIAKPNQYISRTKISDLEAVSKFLKEKYGYDPGSYTDFSADQSVQRILARLDWNISNRHHLALRYNNTLNRAWNPTNGSSSDCGTRTVQSRFSQYSMSFYNSCYSMDNKANTFSFDLNSRLSDHWSNQLLATYSLLDDSRGSTSDKFPFVDILDGTGTYTPYMSFGYELFTWYNGVHNRVLTIKDDATYYAGAHKVTLGASYEYQMADNSYIRNGTGYYRYNSLQDFFDGATPETVNLTYGYDGEENPAARVRYGKYALYGQDDWNVSDNFKLTAGLRLETIVFNNADVMTNNAIKELDYNGLSIDTGAWPTTKLQVSPRVGFSWDVLGDKSLKVRGGTGLFTGRLPLVFFTNMPTNSNMVQLKGVITDGKASGDLLPNFAGGLITNTNELRDKMNSLDPKSYPLSITPEDGVLSKGSSIAAVDPKFKMPQVWKTSVAVDYAFPTSFPLNVTGEYIFNKTVNAVCMRNYNIKPVAGFARLNGPDQRHIYPADAAYTTSDGFMLTNTNAGYGSIASITLNADPTKNIHFTAAYTHTVAKELTGMPGSDASSAFTYVPTIEGPNNAPLHNSQYVEPDRAFASLTIHDNSNNHYSFFWEAWRGGANYTYMTTNDVNGDNYNYDVIYIPKAADELRFKTEDDQARFWAFVENDPYLSAHKGQYSEAYSVYSPWSNRLDFRYTHDFKVKVGNNTNTLQINFDFQNILNLFNSNWGVGKYMNSSLDSGRILKLEEIATDGVPVYSTPAAVSGSTQTWIPSYSIGQCWYAQVGIKYMFN